MLAPQMVVVRHIKDVFDDAFGRVTFGPIGEFFGCGRVAIEVDEAGMRGMYWKNQQVFSCPGLSGSGSKHGCLHSW
jgi:hypothetical protein